MAVYIDERRNLRNTNLVAVLTLPPLVARHMFVQDRSSILNIAYPSANTSLDRYLV